MSPKPRVRTRFILLASATAALAAAGLLAELAGFDRVYERVMRLDPIWLLVCFGGEVLAYVGYALAVRDLSRVDDGPRLSLKLSAKTVVAGFGVFSATRVSGGFAVDYWTLRRAGLRKNDAIARVLALGALEYAVLAPAALASALILFARSQVQNAVSLPWLLVIPGFAGAVWLSQEKRRIRFADPGAGGWLRRHFSHAVAGVSVLRALATRPREHRTGVLGAGLYWFGDIVCLWAALNVFNAHLPIAALVLGYATGYVLTRRSLPLGGAGIIEVSMTFALTWVGLHFTPALLGVVVYRVFTFWLPMVPALPMLPTLRRLRSDLKRDEDAFDASRLAA